jgi:chromosomal replication initiation ATPase DnaA
MKKREEESKKKTVSELIQEAMGYIPDRSEEETGKSFEQKSCPHKICDGSGYLKRNNESGIYTVWCQCYKEEVLRRKMKGSNIESKYWKANFELKHVKTTLLHPKAEWEPPKMIKKGRKEVPESPVDYMKRVYNVMPISKGIAYFGKEYAEKTLQFLEEHPRTKMRNLMLMGEPGRGKTYFACAIGKEYLKHGKTVYFTTMLKPVADVMNPEIDIRKIVNKKDLLIVDEVGYEYHTDTLWAMKQIKELFRSRYNRHLPIVCTTNFYPNELAELYDSSLISMFNGSYFYIMMENERDYRIQEAEEALKDFSFMEKMEEKK